MNRNDPVKSIKGVGEKRAELLNKLNIFNAEDLIYHFPRSYDKYEKAVSLKEAVPGIRNAVCGVISSAPTALRYSGKSVISFFITDINGDRFQGKFFNSPYLLKAIKKGDKKVFRGYLKRTRDGGFVIEQPKMYVPEEYDRLVDTITPIYPLTKDLSNETIKKYVKTVLDAYPFDEDYLDPEDIRELKLSGLKDAFYNIHFPVSEEAQYYARRRIVFDEFLAFMDINRRGSSSSKKENVHRMIECADTKRLEESLPYELTNAQKNAINDILSDLTGDFLMNRLVQGDVGSGKTIVAVMAMLTAAANNMQSALMVPTEVLATQHFENIKSMCDKYSLCIKPVLLTGKMSAGDKRAALAGIESGEYNAVIGTHALITGFVNYKNLSLVITDEQHRFGVKQREALRDKGLSPHILVMSATPIPRTLAMVVFGGTDISVIDEMPKDRIPISNCVINSGKRTAAYEKIRKEIAEGHQAYVICPMVYENDESETELKSVTEHAKELKEYFGETIRIDTLNGKMKPAEKARIMEDFKAHRTDILVSTTVVEVGVDVGNATVIVIENAERFGLSQLHQLRGRVGRGGFASYCILISDTVNKLTQKRLNVLNETNDGFRIAEEDMKLRGPGELNGVMQSGELDFGLADIINDSDILLLAADNYERFKNRLPAEGRNLIDITTI